MSNIALLEVLPPANNSVFEPYFANNVELLFNISIPSSSNATCVAIEAEASASDAEASDNDADDNENDVEASDNDADDNDNDDDAVNNDAVCADADKFALIANVSADCDTELKFSFNNDADVTNSADADASAPCENADADKTALAPKSEAYNSAFSANPRANICEPLDAKSDFVVASLLAEVCVLELASNIFT